MTMDSYNPYDIRESIQATDMAQYYHARTHTESGGERRDFCTKPIYSLRRAEVS